uniref:proteasome subunit beta type-3-like n=1 Tax=Jaculus jaculus TaxID=51337 RepID=UPI001E1B3CD5|nr:proteasome subunit beta type-3-like [Jaculus jaculus]
MSIMSYNGGVTMAMKEKSCVVITAGRNFRIQAHIVPIGFQKVIPMGDRLYTGLARPASDCQTVAQSLKLQLNPYELKEGWQVRPYTLMSMVANLLYEKCEKDIKDKHQIQEFITARNLDEEMPGKRRCHYGGDMAENKYTIILQEEKTNCLPGNGSPPLHLLRPRSHYRGSGYTNTAFTASLKNNSREMVTDTVITQTS